MSFNPGPPMGLSTVSSLHSYIRRQDKLKNDGTPLLSTPDSTQSSCQLKSWLWFHLRNPESGLTPDTLIVAVLDRYWVFTILHFRIKQEQSDVQNSHSLDDRYLPSPDKWVLDHTNISIFNFLEKFVQSNLTVKTKGKILLNFYNFHALALYFTENIFLLQHMSCLAFH